MDTQDEFAGFTEPQRTHLETLVRERYPDHCWGFEVTSIQQQFNCWKMFFSYSTSMNPTVDYNNNMYFTCRQIDTGIEDFIEVK